MSEPACSTCTHSTDHHVRKWERCLIIGCPCQVFTGERNATAEHDKAPLVCQCHDCTQARSLVRAGSLVGALAKLDERLQFTQGYLEGNADSIGEHLAALRQAVERIDEHMGTSADWMQARVLLDFTNKRLTQIERAVATRPARSHAKRKKRG